MTTATVNGTRPIKRRRTKKQMQEIRDGLCELAARHQPCSVRHLFYQATVAGLVDKQETQYKGTLARLLGELREDGSIPFRWIVDNTRWMRKPQSDSSLEEALERTRLTYRRALWDDQDTYVEVWCESDSTAGVVYPITSQFDVPLMVARGFSSKTFIYETAQYLKNEWRDIVLYYLADYDPSGQCAMRTVAKTLKRYGAPDVEFVHLAVTPEQIDNWQLPTRPPKRKKNSHAKTFTDERNRRTGSNRTR